MPFTQCGALGFDAISELVLPDEAAWNEMNRIAAANVEMIKEDEARWFDQVLCWLADCEPIVEDLRALPCPAPSAA